MGVIGLIKIFVKELVSWNIIVNVIVLGFIVIDMMDVLDENIKVEMLKVILVV